MSSRLLVQNEHNDLRKNSATVCWLNLNDNLGNVYFHQENHDFNSNIAIFLVTLFMVELLSAVYLAVANLVRLRILLHC